MFTKILSIFTSPHLEPFTVPRSLKTLLLNMMLLMSIIGLLIGGVLNLIKAPPTHTTLVIYLVSILVVIPARFITRAGNHIDSVSLVVLTLLWVMSTIINIFYQQVALSSYIPLTIMTFLLIHVPAGLVAGIVNVVTIISLFIFRDFFPIPRQTETDIFFIVLNVGNISIVYGIMYVVIMGIIEAQKKYQASTQHLKQEAQYQHDKLLKEYHGVLNGISEAVIITDMQLNIMTWNGASQRIYGHRSDEVLGKKLTDIIPTVFSSDDNQTTMRQRYVEGGLLQNEVIQKRKDATSLYALSSMSLLYDPNNNPIGAITINQEITDYVNSERTIYNLNKDIFTREQLLQDIMTLISEDIRKQLTALRNQASIMQYKPNEALNLIDQLANTILVINDIHQQVKAGKVTKLDIKPLVEGLFTSYQARAEKKDITVSLEIEENLFPLLVKADPALLTKAINHTLDNALTFTHIGGNIAIRLFVHNNHVHYTVSDTGNGLPPHHWKEVFQPYFNHRYNYIPDMIAGLSLYTIKTIVIYYDGALIFDSEYGKGSLFGFTLPHIVPPVL